MFLPLQIMSGHGIDLVRTWGFLNGADDPALDKGALAIQPSVLPYLNPALKCTLQLLPLH